MTPVGVISTEFHVSSVWHGWDCALTTVSGDIGTDLTAQRLSRHLQWVLAAGARYLLVDLAAVHCCGDRALGALVAARDEAFARDGWVCLTGRKSLLDRLAGFTSQATTRRGV